MSVRMTRQDIKRVCDARNKRLAKQDTARLCAARKQFIRTHGSLVGQLGDAPPDLIEAINWIKRITGAKS